MTPTKNDGFGDLSCAATAYAIQANPPIHLIVENGKVTLKGVVANRMDKQVAEAKVRTNVMAFDVINDLQVEELG